MPNRQDMREGDELYFEEEGKPRGRGFDESLIEKPLSHLPKRTPLLFRGEDSATDAMRAMQEQKRGCALITQDGTASGKLLGIFTERDVLFRIVDRGRNPTSLPLTEVMTRDPEAVPADASIAWVLNKMAVGGFRHVPVIDENGCPSGVVAVRDVVQFLVEFFPSEVLNLPPDYSAGHFKNREGA